MKDLPQNDELLEVADRVFWFEPGERGLADPIRFLAYLMNYGYASEVAVVFRYVSLDDFHEALEHAPPGIFTEQAWVRWNNLVGRIPTPPMPKRIIPD